MGSDGDLGRKNPTEDFPDVVKVAATEDERRDDLSQDEIVKMKKNKHPNNALICESGCN